MTITNSDLERALRDGVSDLFTRFSSKHEATHATISNEVAYDIPDPITAWFAAFNNTEVTPGVYKLYVDDECKYIGESLRLKRRLKSHIRTWDPTHFRYATLNSGMWGAHLGSVVGRDGIKKTLSRIEELEASMQEGNIGKVILRAEEQRLIAEYVDQEGEVPEWNTEHPDNYR